MPRSFRFGVARKSDLICSLVLLRCIAIVPTTSAQTAAEAAGATSLSTTYVAPATKAVGIAQANPKSADAAPSLHIVGSGNTATVETNRQAFEAKAGADGAKLLLRSTPSQAQVWLNGLPVGSTPLLLIVPAGKYAVEMRGTRTETRREEVALLPKETREVAMKMQLLYPSRVSAAH